MIFCTKSFVAHVFIYFMICTIDQQYQQDITVFFNNLHNQLAILMSLFTTQILLKDLMFHDKLTKYQSTKLLRLFCTLRVLNSLMKIIERRKTLLLQNFKVVVYAILSFIALFVPLILIILAQFALLFFVYQKQH